MKNCFQIFLLLLAVFAFGCKSDDVKAPEIIAPVTFQIDSTDKFPIISDDALLTLVQKQTFKYFWDFGHPVSGLARERNTSGDVVTSGGSGFGIMTIPIAIERDFITRGQGLERMQKIVAFLKTNTQKFHGAFPHWINGATGAVVPFSAKDDGADLVETSYLIQGLLTARQYFDGNDAAETALRNDINTIWYGVEWDWFRKTNENVLYWHWSPNYNWDMNLPIKGWNECLITYALAASSPTHGIPNSVYENGWTGNGSFKNGNSYYGITLPLGSAYGGPLFFSQYSFLGINPTNLTDKYTNYLTQNQNHTLINYNYCKTNPLKYNGYSELCWGLTASDIQDGYNANSPTSDKGVIAPTAALSAFPYTPTESMKALKFFYFKLGNKLWGDYGFYDAFSLQTPWYASSYLAIDQGPIIIMIENYRSGLPWKLFMSSPEIKTGMKNLGFQSPNL
ncbi:glucoamylase family protein [Dyadobacter sp. 3J3]|uniref:glucoamylase family protein n=1 Tax=Dyadobacter sp. 3J3 TaxID=2606600 RepID=UPI0013578DE8|nr:glucoamylase family protein [Dyadobacter sp. 3J3]